MKPRYLVKMILVFLIPSHNGIKKNEKSDSVDKLTLAMASNKAKFLTLTRNSKSTYFFA